MESEWARRERLFKERAATLQRDKAVRVLSLMVKIRAKDGDLALVNAIGQERAGWALAFARAYWIAHKVDRYRTAGQAYDSLDQKDICWLHYVFLEEWRVSFRAWLEERPGLRALIVEAVGTNSWPLG